MKSSSVPKDTWAWYGANSSLLFFFLKLITTMHIYILLICYGTNPPPFFLKAIQNTFRLEEITNSCYQQLNEERKRKIRATVVQTLNIAEQSNAKLKKKLADEEHARKSADSALEGVERQADSQRKLAREANDQLAASKEQLATLKKQLEEAQKLRAQAEKAKAEAEKARVDVEKEKDEAEQHGYDVGVVETGEAHRAEVPVVCQAYCAQTWEEALNRAGIDAFSELRRPENVFFLLAIRVPAPPVTKPAKDAQLQNPPPPS